MDLKWRAVLGSLFVATIQVCSQAREYDLPPLKLESLNSIRVGELILPLINTRINVKYEYVSIVKKLDFTL